MEDPRLNKEILFSFPETGHALTRLHGSWLHVRADLLYTLS